MCINYIKNIFKAGKHTVGPVVENCQWDQTFVAESLAGEYVGGASSTLTLGFRVAFFFNNSL